MKKIIRYTILGAFLIGGFTSCEDYLDKAPASSLNDSDIFGKYETFQGYEDQMYLYLMEPLAYPNGGMWFSDETHATGSPSTSYLAIRGDYWNLLYNGGAGVAGNTSLFFSNQQGGKIGFWSGSWYGIRIANMALSQLPTLEAAQTASQEQKDLLKGTALFMRSYFHYTIMSIWGGMPYIDTLLTTDMDIRYPRLPLKVGMRRSVDDMLASAQLLPASWDETADGLLRPGANEGRPTKGAAYGMAAKALLFMASPLNNEGYQYDETLCKESAQYGWEVIKLADSGYFKLMNVTEDKGDPGDNDYKRNFVGATNTSSPYTKENVFARYFNWAYTSDNAMWYTISKLFMPLSSRGTAQCVAPSQNLVDLFETTNGKLPEDDPTYNPLKPWVNRDPRFYNAILTDGTAMYSNYTVQCYAFDQNGVAGRDFGSGQSQTGYYMKKYWIYGCVTGGNKTGVNANTPHLRLPEVYLNYAEALIAAGYAPTTQPTFANGETGISALEAMNTLRHRVYTKTSQPILPDLDMALNGGQGKDGTVKGTFMKKIWDERSVELCFERSRWIDLRRWHVAHLDKYRNIYGMRFNKAQTQFEKVLLDKIVFEEKHYWMPIPTQQIGLFKDYKQNPGW